MLPSSSSFLMEADTHVAAGDFYCAPPLQTLPPPPRPSSAAPSPCRGATCTGLSCSRRHAFIRMRSCPSTKAGGFKVSCFGTCAGWRAFSFLARTSAASFRLFCGSASRALPARQQASHCDGLVCFAVLDLRCELRQSPPSAATTWPLRIRGSDCRNGEDGKAAPFPPAPIPYLVSAGWLFLWLRQSHARHPHPARAYSLRGLLPCQPAPPFVLAFARMGRACLAGSELLLTGRHSSPPIALKTSASAPACRWRIDLAHPAQIELRLEGLVLGLLAFASPTNVPASPSEGLVLGVLAFASLPRPFLGASPSEGLVLGGVAFASLPNPCPASPSPPAQQICVAPEAG